ncbi:MAG: YceH family protein [Mariprofundus sp.]
MGEPVTGMLSAHEARVLGCLMEKQMTTPDYYPLTLKALTAACNQKSSRAPVLSLSESEVGGVVNALRSEGLVTARMDGRADRFEQHLSRKLELSSKERAVLCVLMLRSALTINEIRINTGRMVTFESSDALQAVLDGLMSRDEPLLVRIPRVAGQREDRYAHLLCGMPELTAAAPASSGGSKAADRIEALEQEVADLKADLQRLWQLTGLPGA